MHMYIDDAYTYAFLECCWTHVHAHTHPKDRQTQVQLNAFKSEVLRIKTWMELKLIKNFNKIPLEAIWLSMTFYK